MGSRLFPSSPSPGRTSLVRHRQIVPAYFGRASAPSCAYLEFGAVEKETVVGTTVH